MCLLSAFRYFGYSDLADGLVKRLNNIQGYTKMMINSKDILKRKKNKTYEWNHSKEGKKSDGDDGNKLIKWKRNDIDWSAKIDFAENWVCTRIV